MVEFVLQIADIRFGPRLAEFASIGVTPNRTTECGRARAGRAERTALLAAKRKYLAERNKSEGSVRRLRGMTTILRKYHSVARCTLLGEIIEDTATRYYYRLRSPAMN